MEDDPKGEGREECTMKGNSRERTISGFKVDVLLSQIEMTPSVGSLPMQQLIR